MREFSLVLLVALSAFCAGANTAYFVERFAEQKCECPCCKPDEAKPHRPLRPNGSMPGSTGSMGSLGAK